VATVFGAFTFPVLSMGDIARELHGNLQEAEQEGELQAGETENVKKALQAIYAYADNEARQTIKEVYQKTPINGDLSELQQPASQQQQAEVPSEFQKVVKAVEQAENKQEEAVKAVQLLFGNVPQEGKVAQAAGDAQLAASSMPGAQLGEAINRNFTVEASQ